LVLSRVELIGVVLDDGVGEELFAHALDLGAGAAGVGLDHLDLDIFALAHVANGAEAERMQRAGVMVMRAFILPRRDRYFERTSTGPVRVRIGLSTCSPSRRATS
jgi:hypothetical protein